jgi:hypothetical protein
MRADPVLSERIANADPALREDLRAYVKTATGLEAQGQQEACKSVVDAVRALLSDPDASPEQAMSSEPVEASKNGDETTDKAEEARSGKTAPGEADDAQDDGERTTVSERGAAIEDYATTQEFNASTDDDAIGRDLAERTREGAAPVWESHDYTEGAKRAEPFETVAGRISSEQIVDADVRSLDGQALGVAEGFLTTHEGITDIIIGYGGFLDIGDREVAVPIDRLRYDRVDGVFYTSTDIGWLDDQPDWDKERWFSEPNFWLRDP